MRTSAARLPSLLLIAAVGLAALPNAAAEAASRARFGGTLKLAMTGRGLPADPTLADSPAEAALASLLSPGLCRLDAAGRVQPVLAAELSRPSSSLVRVSLRPGLSTAEGSPVGPREVAASWARLHRPTSPSPYRALLFPVRGEGRLPVASPSSGAIELPLAFSWPDLEQSLCHPALGFGEPRTGASLGLGAYRSTAGREGGREPLTAHLGFPGGRPYPDRLSLLPTSERGAARMLALKQAHLVLGATGDGAASVPALHATYLAFAPAKAGAEFRSLFEAVVDREALVRFFVRGPAVSMHQLLPPALMPQKPAPRPPPPPAQPPRALTLLYDASLEDQRAVAERIQVKLHDRGVKVALQALPRAELRARWARGDFELMLHAVLLPPLAGPALAVVLETAGRHELLASELPPIGAEADAAGREARAVERAEALGPSLPLIPLYAQALRVEAAPTLAGLAFDAQGLPLLDQLFLLE